MTEEALQEDFTAFMKRVLTEMVLPKSEISWRLVLNYLQHSFRFGENANSLRTDLLLDDSHPSVREDKKMREKNRIRNSTKNLVKRFNSNHSCSVERLTTKEGQPKSQMDQKTSYMGKGSCCTSELFVKDVDTKCCAQT